MILEVFKNILSSKIENNFIYGDFYKAHIDIENIII